MANPHFSRNLFHVSNVKTELQRIWRNMLRCLGILLSSFPLPRSFPGPHCCALLFSLIEVKFTERVICHFKGYPAFGPSSPLLPAQGWGFPLTRVSPVPFLQVPGALCHQIFRVFVTFSQLLLQRCCPRLTVSLSRLTAFAFQMSFCLTLSHFLIFIFFFCYYLYFENKIHQVIFVP